MVFTIPKRVVKLDDYDHNGVYVEVLSILQSNQFSKGWNEEWPPTTLKTSTARTTSPGPRIQKDADRRILKELFSCYYRANKPGILFGYFRRELQKMDIQKAKPSKRLDLQGIRALAILVVLGFHFFPEYFPNGYLGVDQ
uniref:Acyl_transf_3 domain-containing protein n=1 Tax=Caenorhabditis tropicalis TaxID=1561998 RepID=A0A1I7UFR7_9PELO